MITSATDDLTTSLSASENTTIYTVDDLNFANGEELTLKKGFIQQLFLNLHLSNGKTYHNIKSDIKTPLYGVDEEVVWYINDERIAQFLRPGLVLGGAAGSTTVVATVANQSVALSLTVTEVDAEFIEDESTTDVAAQDESIPVDDADESETPPSEEAYVSEQPLDSTDVFLNENDVITLNLASDGGFGSDNFPLILYGPPVDVYDVVSLGTGGGTHD